jgi:hypothetical protein
MRLSLFRAGSVAGQDRKEKGSFAGKPWERGRDFDAYQGKIRPFGLKAFQTFEFNPEGRV